MSSCSTKSTGSVESISFWIAKFATSWFIFPTHSKVSAVFICRYLLLGLCEKYPEFNELIEYRDADIFMMIPMIMILKAIEGTDRGICEYFLPDIKVKQTPSGEMFDSICELLYQSNSKMQQPQKNDGLRDRSLGRTIRISRNGLG